MFDSICLKEHLSETHNMTSTQIVPCMLEKYTCVTFKDLPVVILTVVWLDKSGLMKNTMKNKWDKSKFLPILHYKQIKTNAKICKYAMTPVCPANGCVAEPRCIV